MSPRVKLIYHGDDKWLPPTARFGACPHPRETLRFDPRFVLPTSCYCLACGEAYINPWHGASPEQVAEARERAKALLADLGWDGER